MKKDLLRISDLSRDEISFFISRGMELKRMNHEGISHRPLSGKTLAMIFEKSSTRTRVSFEAGMFQLGGAALFLSHQETQIGRGEPVKDTARVLSRYVDAIMIRTFHQRDVEELASYSSVPVINGLTDEHHPCQILGDLMTADQFGKDVARLKLCYVGDGNNVANSLVEAAMALGFTLVLACPQGYEPRSEIMKEALKLDNINILREPEKAADGADVLYTDVWTSMGQEQESSERSRAFAGYRVDSSLLSRAKPDTIVMHCLPAHRGEEITDEVVEGEKSVVFDQAENRLHIQKAILETLIK